MPILALLALIAGVALFERDRGRRHAVSAPSAHVAGAATPLASSLAYLRAGQAPPPQLAQWAIAEAESLGRRDVASMLYQRFVAPFGAPYALQPSGPASQENPAGGSFSPSAYPASVAPVPVAAPSMPVPRSPIDGVSDGAWTALCQRIDRGDLSYASQKRVGRYHQSRTRLGELGFAAEALIGNPVAQNDALAADLVDGLERARDKGLLASIGQPVAIPGSEPGAPAPVVSLSGVLGVLSVAGASGLAGWLSSPGDRQRFPFTTNLFLQTNGIF